MKNARPKEELEAKLLEGLDSADVELTPDDWRAIRMEALARLGVRSESR
ncbi:MAG TPA: hypothetical protein PK177_18635 [Burkholderiaceae bacterium]|nr:hypothetical protein [Burkholderiaceae bacterium]